MLFEAFGGFWAYQEPELMAKIKEFETQYNVLVYAVTHEYTNFGECYDFLYIPDDKSDWKYMLMPQKRCFTFRHTYGTNLTICVRNSERSASVLSAAASKGLCEARYERI